MLAIISTILVYTGFGFISQFSFWFVKFPHRPRLGIIILLLSNVLWVIKFAMTGDVTEMLWQAGFIVINAKWLAKETL